MTTGISISRRTRIALAVALAGLMLATGGAVASTCAGEYDTSEANDSAQDSTVAVTTVETQPETETTTTETENTTETGNETEALLPGTDLPGDAPFLECAPNCPGEGPGFDRNETSDPNATDPFEDPDTPVVEVNDSMAETPDTGLPLQSAQPTTEFVSGENQTVTEGEPATYTVHVHTPPTDGEPVTVTLAIGPPENFVPGDTVTFNASQASDGINETVTLTYPHTATGAKATTTQVAAVTRYDRAVTTLTVTPPEDN